MKNTRTIPLVLAFFTANIAFGADEIHWTITGQTSVTFDWRGTDLEKSIGYGLSPGAYTQLEGHKPNPVPTSSKGPFWEAKLTGLKENSLYYYSIGNGPERTFLTPPPKGSSDFTIYAQGDIGDTGNYFNVGTVQQLITDGKPAFVVGLGDLSLGSKNGKAAVDQHFNDVMTWSKEAAYMPVWGDLDWHRSKFDGFNNYKGRFDVPNPQTSLGSPLAGGEDWYWFDYGNARFITLPEPLSGAWTAWKTKADILMAEAQADPTIKYIVTLVHRPAYSSGHHHGSPLLRGILNKLGDTYSKYVLNLNADSVNYERSHPQHGVVHVTAGIGGSDLQQDGPCLWLTCKKPAWSAFRAMHHGALKLHFTESAIQGSFICGPKGGGTNDINCVQGETVDNFMIQAVAAGTSAARSTTRALGTTTCAQTALNVSAASSDTGYSYIMLKTFGIPADTNTFLTQSALRLFENGVELSPPHAKHADIRTYGQGRFSHFLTSTGIETLRFSASDNTNPKTNGKSYSYCTSADAQATSTDSQAPTVPGAFSATAGSSTQIGLSWTPSSDNVGVTGYKVSRNGVQIGTPASTTYTDSGLAPATNYTYSVVAVDAAGNTSGPASGTAATAAASTADTQAPTVPGALNARANSQTQIGLSWTASSDNVGVTGYRVSRNGVQIGITTATSYVDPDLSAATSYTYSVVAIDAAGNASSPASGTGTTSPANATGTCTSVTALNVAAAASDTGYGYIINQSFGVPADTSTFPKRSVLRVFENGIELSPPHSIHANIRTYGQGRFSHSATSTGIESLRFSALDNSNPKTNGKTYVYCTTNTTDVQPPSTPGSFSATASSSTQVDLSWTVSSDNIGVTGYKVFRNGVQIGTTTSTTYKDTGLSAGSSYTYSVSAIDAIGNLSVPSASIVTPGTTAASCAPAPTSTLVVNVKDKGAIGNGSTNDTAAIQAAINQVAGTGGTVLIPDGTYMIDAVTRLNAKNNITIRLSSNAVLKAIANNQANYGIIRIENVSNVNVIGGKLQGERAQHQSTTGEWGMGVEIYTANNVVIEGVTAVDMWGDGYYIGRNSANVTMCSVIADNNRRQGITVTSVNGAVIKNSIFRNSKGTHPSAGMDIEPNDGEIINNLQVLNSQFNNNQKSGIQLSFPSVAAASSASVSNVTISGNTIINNGVVGTYSAGIYISAHKYVKITNNIVKDNAQDGIIMINGARNNTINGNTVTGSGYNNNTDLNIGNGIIMYGTGSTANIVTNNIVIGNKKAVSDATGGNVITPNTAK